MNEADSQVDIFRFNLLVVIIFDIRQNWRINKTEDEATSDSFSLLLCVTLKARRNENKN